MNEPMIGSFQWMKSLNRSLVLNTIRTHKEIPRAEIAKLTKLTPPTVTNIVAELMHNRLVVEGDLGISTGGRRPIPLRINEEAYHIVGIDVGVTRIRAVVTNLNADMKAALSSPLPAKVDKITLLAHLRQSIEQVLSKARIPSTELMGIGVGMHGVVDPQEGVSVFAPNLGLHHTAIRFPLEQAFSVPVHVENDVVAFALGESWFGAGREVPNFIAVNIGEGVGAGIMLNGQIYKGATFSAGEIGHATVDSQGPKCSCGNYGCLQAFVSGPSLAKLAASRIRNGESSMISSLCNGNLELISGDMIYNAARQGDQLAKSIFEQSGRYLGIGLANLINTLNPQKIILGGGVTGAAPYFTEILLDTIATRALKSSASGVTITVSELGEYATAIGAVTIVLNGLFSPHIG